MGVDEPEFPLLEKDQQQLVPDELETHYGVFEGFGQADALGDVALVVEEADVLESGVLLAEGEDLGLVRSDGYGPAVTRE